MTTDGVKVGVAEMLPIISESLAAGNTVRLVVTGTSMYPLLTPERDSVVIEPASAVKKCDVALYRRDNGIMVLHRVVKVKNDGFYCVGDNQIKVEGPLRFDQLLGKATVLIRNGKEVSVKSFRYRLYAYFWTIFRPIRKGVVFVLRKVKRLFKGHRNEKEKQ